VRSLLFVFIFCFFGTSVFAQLSQGGSPIEIPGLKSTSPNQVICLPRLDNAKLLLKSKELAGDGELKPFRFAESIPVNITPENSGEWFETDEYRIWQVEILSKGAKTLNLVFNQYYLPEEARLFIFSADRKDLIGAFTAQNNKDCRILPTSPVVGDHVVVQYEEPLKADFKGELSIGTVNHDFIGIKSIDNDRRPLGVSGSCNVNVNCDIVEKHREQANAVVRILIGNELCSGTLLNNTLNDGTPYVYTAGHCIENQAEANTSIFLFDYESPYCGEIDGDASRTLSGSILKAQSDSIDFSLVELSVDPPNIYRPYFLGWDRSAALPDSSVCIHHPQGDVKKIAADKHSPKINSYSNKYIKNAFFYIGNWESGTTEGGSSGAALINQDGHLVGSLTGGAATCEDPTRDYFSRLFFAWDYYADQTKSVRIWLDPNNSGKTKIDGINPYSGPLACGAFTNFRDEDEHRLIAMTENGVYKGLWTGNNDYGFSVFAEKFELDSSCDVAGVSLGVAKAKVAKINSKSTVDIQVYDGAFFPSDLIYEQSYPLKDVDPGVMNYFEFNKVVSTHTGHFFIAYALNLEQPTDTFSVYMANRTVDPLNSFYLKDGAEWYTFPQKVNASNGSALLMEAILCNVDLGLDNPSLKSEKVPLKAFPNPLNEGHLLYLKFEDEVDPEKVEIFDLIGRRIQLPYQQLSENWLSLDFTGNIPGTYLVRVLNHSKNYQTKILYLGN